MKALRRFGSLRWAERVLGTLGLLLFAYCGFYLLEMHSASAASASAGVQSASPSPSQMEQDDRDTQADPVEGVIGRIQIPQLHIVAPITNGIGKLELIRGVGHIPGTAFPGGLGTMALAGHRDTFFRGLEHVSLGMRIRATGGDGTYQYQIDSTQIVTPEQVQILEIGNEPSLVLITCYPFHYIGAAPKRFIVHAKLLSLDPEPR